jgi:hypothetical protein
MMEFLVEEGCRIPPIEFQTLIESMPMPIEAEYSKQLSKQRHGNPAYPRGLLTAISHCQLWPLLYTVISDITDCIGQCVYYITELSRVPPKLVPLLVRAVFGGRRQRPSSHH